MVINSAKTKMAQMLEFMAKTLKQLLYKDASKKAIINI